MILYRDISWWYWAASEVLLVAGLAGVAGAFPLVVVLALVQVIHFRTREGSFAAFPVQVRLAYAAIVITAPWPPLNWVYWLPAIGTMAQVTVGYCPLARTLSLLSWNRTDPLTWELMRRTFLSPPVRGSVLQGLPPLPSDAGSGR